MTKDKFRVIVSGIVTNQGETLIGQKVEKEGHPYSEEWHFPGGHMDRDEDVKNAVKREIKEETGQEVEVHHLVDTYVTDSGAVRILFHCGAKKKDAEAADDLKDVKWVEPGELEQELDKEADMIGRREEVEKFLKKLEKAPVL